MSDEAPSISHFALASLGIDCQYSQSILNRPMYNILRCSQTVGADMGGNHHIRKWREWPLQKKRRHCATQPINKTTAII